MDDKDPILEHPGTHETAVHVRDYERFIGMLKFGTIVVILTLLLVLYVLV